MSKIIKDRFIRGLEITIELLGLALLVVSVINQTKKGKK
jgi:hypothetical protein